MTERITKNKKAQTMKWVIRLVIMLVVIVVLITLPRMIGEAAEKSAERAACKKSLELSENLKIVAGSFADRMGNFARIDCPTEYLELHSTEEKLAKDVADNLYDCWDLYSKRKSLFDQSSGTYCIICKDLTLLSDEGEIDNLVGYIETKKAPTAKGGTYLQSFGGVTKFKAANTNYNPYRFSQGEETAVIVTFGTINFAGTHLVFNRETGIGMLLHPYRDIASLGCYQLEGRTTALQYKR